MTTEKIEYMLRDLERQVHDFTLQSLNDSRPLANTTVDSRHRNIQASTAAANITNSDHFPSRANDPLDDDVSIGTILKRSATARRPDKPTANLAPHSKSLRLKKREEFTLDNEDLKLAMQQALKANEVEATSAHSKTVTTRIYIDDAHKHKVVQLTNLLTSAMVVQYLKKKGLLDSSDDWTLFEIDNVHGVERPLREWEIVLDIINGWDVDASNALLVKKYAYHYTLTPNNILQRKTQPMFGWVSIEYKKGKWQKRFCFVKDNAIYHSKDNKGSNPSILCHLASYDVYTLLQPLKVSPTPCVIAIRAQDKSSIFERKSDFMRFLAVDTPEELENWVLSIRDAKSTIQYQQVPTRVTCPLSPVSDSSSPLRRQKSMKDIKLAEHANMPPTVPHSDSTRRVGDDKRHLGRSATTRHRNPSAGDNTTEPSTFVKGSLLAKEETPEQILYRQQQQQQLLQQQQPYHHEDSNNSTLIQIEDRVKFSKGSLLDQKENGVKLTRSKSMKEHSDEVRRHQSLKRKPTRRQHHDVPLPNNAAIASLPPPPQPMSETSPSRRLFKPLLNFDDKK